MRFQSGHQIVVTYRRTYASIDSVFAHCIQHVVAMSISEANMISNPDCHGKRTLGLDPLCNLHFILGRTLI